MSYAALAVHHSEADMGEEENNQIPRTRNDGLSGRVRAVTSERGFAGGVSEAAPASAGAEQQSPRLSGGRTEVSKKSTNE